MRTQRMRAVLRAVNVVALVALVGLIGLVVPEAETQAASSFADPKFEAQWKAGEAITPNFWGPLANAKEKTTEPYGGTMRTIQYFDKGRMELTSGTVTNGLLATEMIRGQVQTGDATSEAKTAPAIPIAGDATNPGPTYAALAGPAAALIAPTTSKVSDTDRSGITTSVEADGTIGMFTPGGSYVQAAPGVFDAPTKHNVARTFVAYRDKAGLTTIGYAIGEPFWANVLVGGERKAVLIQPFERRVLTYTPTNPTGFEVEMGNIGQHYYRWRFEGGGAQPTATTTTATGTPGTPGTTATATTDANGTTVPTSTGLIPLAPDLANATVYAASTSQAATREARSRITPVVGVVREEPTPTLIPFFATVAAATSIAQGTPAASAASAAAATAPVTTSSGALTFQAAPASLTRGSNATITANAPANAYCTITVTYPNGPTHVEGLQDKTADANGKVSWTWRVGSSAATGTTPVEIVCTANGQKLTATATTYVSA